MTALGKITCIFLLVALTIYGLVVGQDFLLPFVLAVVIWFFLVAITGGIQALSFGKFTIPYWLAFLGSFLILFGLGHLVFSIFSSNVFSFIEQAPTYQVKFVRLYRSLMAYLGLEEPPYFFGELNQINFVNLITRFLAMITLIASNMGLILIYILFLLLEQHTFPRKLQAMIRNAKNLESANEVLGEIGTRVQSYVRLKTLFSLLTGLASYLIMLGVGLDFAGFWAFLIFLLNYIPTIGSFVATTLPLLFSILQFEAWTPFLILAVCLIGIQFVIGNILEPPLMGRSFDLSTLVILLSLALWGRIWGIIGMFLCVPIMVIVKIILDVFPSSRPLAIFLSSGRYLSEPGRRGKARSH